MALDNNTGNIINIKGYSDKTHKIDDMDDVERLLLLCADSNSCCDFGDYLSEISREELPEEELELVAGGNGDIWKKFISSLGK